MQNPVPCATRLSDSGESSTSNTQFERLHLQSTCDLCSNPYPYMCSECCELLASPDDIAEDTAMFEKKINIASGEDVCLL
jgi:hypothetical protein